MFTNAIILGNLSWALTAKVFITCLFVFEYDLEKETK